MGRYYTGRWSDNAATILFEESLFDQHKVWPSQLLSRYFVI